MKRFGGVGGQFGQVNSINKLGIKVEKATKPTADVAPDPSHAPSLLSVLVNGRQVSVDISS